MKKNRLLIFFVLPALISYTIFFVIPILGDIYLSFMEWNGGKVPMKFIGFDNYKKLFSFDSPFYNALLHNVIYTTTVVVLQLTTALIFALILVKKFIGNNLFKTIFLLPVVLSNVTLALVWSYMYEPMNGFINYFFGTTGLDFLQNNWLGDKKLALISIAFINAWQYAGYSMIIFIAGLLTIDESMYEAAEIDGAGRLRKFIYITLPLLAPVITINLILSTTGSFKVFDLIYVITPPGGPVSDATEVLTTLTYKTGFTYGEMGYASAISFVLLLIIMLIGFIQLNILTKKE